MIMGIFVNPTNGAFQVALNSEIYVDKTGLIEHTNKVLNTVQGYITSISNTSLLKISTFTPLMRFS